MSDEISIEVATVDDWPAMYALDNATFHQAHDDTLRDALAKVVDFPRTLVARRGGDIVGTAGSYVRDLVVPGAVVPTAHVTLVSVATTARRQGVLTRFMKRLFDDALTADEPIAALWASEGRIYPRFGYGLASRRMSITVPTREIRLAAEPGPGRVREAPPDQLRDTMVKIYGDVLASRPGWSSRTQRHWDMRLADFPAMREGATPLRTVVHEGPDGVDGYAMFRTKGEWNDGGPEGEVRIREVVAANPAASVALWRFLLDIDLTRKVTWWCASVDDPLYYLVDEPRRLIPTLADGLWVRILDLPAALTSRRYAAPVDVVLEVTDTRITSNAGRWRLTATTEGATCVPTTDEPDLAVDIKELGAAYLGGTSLGSLAAIGLVRELRPGTLGPTSTAFSWWVTPSMLEMF